MDQLRALLNGTTIASIVEQDDVLSLEHNQTVGDALKLLAKHDILSAPLVVSPGLEDIESLEPTETSSALVGWLDIKDIIRSFLAFLHEHRPNLPTNMLALMTELEKQGPIFATKMLITIIGGEDRGLVYQTDGEASVLTAIQDMFLGQPDGGSLVHRLAIFDAHGDITRIVSQTDVLRLLRQHLGELGAVADQTLEALGLYKPDMAPEVVRLQPTTPTLLAYKQLADAGVTGAPVVSAGGQLIANLSISDIRGIQPDHFGVLALPVAEFLAVKHGTTYLGYSQHGSSSARHPFFASGPSNTGRSPADADAADADAMTTGASMGQGTLAAAMEPDNGMVPDDNQGRQTGGAATDTAVPSAAGASSGVGLALEVPAGLSSPGKSSHRAGGLGPSGGNLHLHHHRHRTARRPSSGVGLRLITCTPDATLGAVITQMCDNHVHRVYICMESEAGQEVVGVVTPTDILSHIAGQAGWLRRTLSARHTSCKRQAQAPADVCTAAALQKAVEAVTAAAAEDGAGAFLDAENGSKRTRVEAV